MCKELKNIWNSQELDNQLEAYDTSSFQKLIKMRMRTHTNKVMKYFWSSFVLEMGVFALLCHVVVRHWNDVSPLFIVSVLGILLHIPFTYMLMKKFKAMAVARPGDGSASSLYRWVKERHDLLSSFYRFKRNYERFLVPLSTIVGCYLVFELYVPGDGMGYWNVFWVMVVITIISCAVVLRRENKEHFEEPLHQYRILLTEFEDQGTSA